MHIIWHGQNCFQIITQKIKDGQVNIVIDPFSKEIGLKPPSLSADILLISHNQHHNLKSIKGNPFLISGPGEYEVKRVFIQGIPSKELSDKQSERNTIYTIESEEIRICYLGNLKQKELNKNQLEEIGEVDILIIPIGGTDTINSKQASEIINQIEPKIVIPMHYQIPKLKLKLKSLKEFLKVMGQSSIEPQNKLIIKKKNLSGEEIKIIVLKP